MLLSIWTFTMSVLPWLFGAWTKKYIETNEHNLWDRTMYSKVEELGQGVGNTAHLFTKANQSDVVLKSNDTDIAFLNILLHM